MVFNIHVECQIRETKFYHFYFYYSSIYNISCQLSQKVALEATRLRGGRGVWGQYT